MVLADSIDTAQDFVQTLFYVYLALIFAYIITSWIPLPYNLWLNRIQRFIYDVVDPYIRIFRRFVPQLSLGGLGLDLSPIVAILVLYALNAIVQQGIEALR
ncbi:MAG: YggT family protein [Actinomycetota bacterium]|jgi:YggT family protein|nr:YggT family protein [Actinomycetota bacterium]